MQARISALLLAFVLALTGLAAAQETTGAITGRITDTQSLAVPGATITVTNIQTGAARTFVADSDGRYTAANLQPGRYKVLFELTGFSKVERDDVSVALGRSFELNAQMAVGALTETVEVTGVANPLVDTRSTLIAHNVSSEEIDLLPKGRSFQSIALSAPSVNQGELEGGMQVNGASGAENSFTVDGVVTNSVLYGQSRQNTVFEYLQEVQVKTSGISAEYGGALGGVVSAVTKSGGNVLQGEGHYYFEGSPLAAAPVKRLNLDPIDDHTVRLVQDTKDPNHQNEFGGSAGGPIVKNRLFFFGSYSPRNERRTNTYNLTDGTQSVERTLWKQQAFGKVSYATSRMNASWSALWTPTKATGTLETYYKGSTPNSQPATKASITPQIDRGYESNQVNTSGKVDLTVTNTSFLSLRGGLFHDRYSDTGIPTTTSYNYQTPTTTLNAIIPPALQGGTNPSGVNTPRSLITSFDTTKRATFDVDYNHVLNAGKAGLHTIKGGFGYQHISNDVNSYYPGGYVDIFWDRSFSFGGVTQGTGRGIYGYYAVNNRLIAKPASSDIKSIYAQDQWSMGNHLSLNLGLRTEHERVPTFRPDILRYAFDFGWKDKMAPRLGAAYDLWGDGRAKVFASWGRYYDWTKYESPRGSFGAETWCIDYRALDTLDLGSLNLKNEPGRDLWITPGTCRDRRVPSFQNSIDPNTKPMSQDSTSAGLEYQLGKSGVLSAHYIHNNLRTTIEDIGFLDPTGNEGYLYANPGEGLTKYQFPTGKTPPGQLTPKPIRKYDALELGYSRRYANNWFFNANYTLSRLYGNYSGIASSDEITGPTTGVTSAAYQQQSGTIARPGGNESRAWDLDELLWDSHGHNDVVGRLATDRPHVVKLYGSYRAPFKTQFGAFFLGSSGTPLTTYVMSTNTTGGVGSMVNGRGDMGRTPVLTRTDLLISQEVGVAGAKKLRFELNVANLFNQKTAVHIFNGLNRGTGAGLPRQSAAIDLSGTDLTKGYDYNALILKTPEGAGAYDPRYGKPDLFQDGLHAYATVRFLF